MADINQQTIGQLVESNRNIANTMVDIKDNLKTLNDHNILHNENTFFNTFYIFFIIINRFYYSFNI